MKKLCHCRSGKSFFKCCEPFLSGAALPLTAEKLMRSRFSAFCEANVNYLIHTQHPNNRSGNDHAEIGATIKGTEWVNLILLSAERGGENDDTGYVEFVAVSKRRSLNMLSGSSDGADELRQMHERSFFVKEEGKWFYVDGENLSFYQTKRNEPCWCGSGSKTKACHR